MLKVKDVATVGGGMSPSHEVDLDDLRLLTPLPVLAMCVLSTVPAGGAVSKMQP